MLLGGCGTLSFYGQATWGQWRLMMAREPVADLLADVATPAPLKHQLELSQALLDFAESELGLGVGKRYRSYVSLEREAVVWNVFAAPRFSVVGEEWCYPFVGCAPYRGYFDEADAQAWAAGLRDEGLTTFVGGVPAYSTLGWFDDPILSTFVEWPEGDLANLLFHELAHSVVWVSGDAAFNESFASFVGETAVRAWFEAQADETGYRAWRATRKSVARFRGFSLAAKALLEAAYAESAALALPEQEAARGAAFDTIRGCYTAARDELGGGLYDELMQDRFDNAYLVSVGTYADWRASFAALYAIAGEDWPSFYDEVRVLGELDAAARLTRLEALAEQQVDHAADDDDADQIQCEAFAHHGGEREAPG